MIRGARATRAAEQPPRYGGRGRPRDSDERERGQTGDAPEGKRAGDESFGDDEDDEDDEVTPVTPLRIVPALAPPVLVRAPPMPSRASGPRARATRASAPAYGPTNATASVPTYIPYAPCAVCRAGRLTVIEPGGRYLRSLRCPMCRGLGWSRQARPRPPR